MGIFSQPFPNISSFSWPSFCGFKAWGPLPAESTQCASMAGSTLLLWGWEGGKGGRGCGRLGVPSSLGALLSSFCLGCLKLWPLLQKLLALVEKILKWASHLWKPGKEINNRGHFSQFSCASHPCGYRNTEVEVNVVWVIVLCFNLQMWSWPHPEDVPSPSLLSGNAVMSLPSGWHMTAISVTLRLFCRP